MWVAKKSVALNLVCANNACLVNLDLACLTEDPVQPHFDSSTARDWRNTFTENKIDEGYANETSSTLGILFGHQDW